MELLIALAIIIGLLLLIVLLAKRGKGKDMFIKRQNHIQGFPPDRENSHRKYELPLPMALHAIKQRYPRGHRLLIPTLYKLSLINTRRCFGYYLS